MFNIQSNISSLPGLPGYGVLGNDGEKGLNGIALYISSLNGISDKDIITEIIKRQKDLNGTGTNIPGYPKRTYQTGDYFIDVTSKIYQIDLSTESKFISTSLKLDSLDIFEWSQITNELGYNRYLNMSSNNKIIIDEVITSNKENYIKTLDNDSYGVKFKDYGKVSFNDNKDANAIIDFELLTCGKSNHEAIVLRHNPDTNEFIVGNRDETNIRNTNLILDLDNVQVNRGKIIDVNDTINNILTTNECFTTHLFNFNNDPTGISITSSNNSVNIKWDKTKFFKKVTQSDLNKIQIDLIFYQPISITGNTYNFDTTPNNNIYIYSLPEKGNVTIANLAEQTIYKCYLQFSYNGYFRISNLMGTKTGVMPTLSIECDGVTYKNGDTLNIPAMLSKSIYTFNVNTDSAMGWSINDMYNTFTQINIKKGIGKTFFNISINSNNYTSTERTDKFIISLDQYSSTAITVYIKQDKFNGELSCNPTSLSYSYTGELKTFAVNTNLGSWTILGPQWCEITAPNGMIGNQNVNVKALENTSTMARTANVSIVSTNRPDIISNVNISQEGKPVRPNWVTADPSGLLFDGDGTEQIVSLTFNNEEYFEVLTPSWMTSTPTGGYPEVPPRKRDNTDIFGPIAGIFIYKIKLKCSSYIGSMRNGVVTIKNGNGACQINVTQNSIVAPPSIILDPNDRGGGGCLEINTPAILSNGWSVPVGKLNPGDKILGHYGENIYEFGYKGYDDKPRIFINTVIGNEIKEFDYYYEINNEFKCSETHNTFIFRDGLWQWVLSPYLKEGDLLFHISGNHVPITSIKHVNAPIKVAYLSLLRPNTYFGAGYLHHNTAFQKERWIGD